jgi:two-component system, NtrC family, sensor kinase
MPRALARMTSGLGLSLVKDIIERHNGHVTVGDALGGGASFEIRLPLQLKTQAAPTT